MALLVNEQMLVGVGKDKLDVNKTIPADAY